MDVGARLKEARIERGLSLDSLEETTKIQKRYLTAIEEGNFHILPGKFYARAFIKEYANAVGINPDELLEEHKEEIPKSEEESEIRYTRIERSRRENNSERSNAVFSVLPKVIVVLLIIGILVAAIIFCSQSRSSNDPTEIEEPDNNVIITNPDDNNPQSPAEDDDETAEDNETAEEPEEDGEPEEMEIEVAEVGTGPRPESTITLINPGDELIFVFESENRVWLDVKNNEETFFSSFVEEANSPLELDLTGEEPIYLNIGSAPNLNIQINGVELEYPVDPNQSDVQRMWINADQ